jgi:hypothetical protein
MPARVAKLALVSALLIASADASAGPAPKPSQLVTARASSTPCPIEFSVPNTGYQITSMSTSDGIQTPFAIPPKQVLVITSVNLNMTGAPANETGQISLIAVNGTDGSVLAEGLGTTNADGLLTIDRILPTGISVRSGVPLCVLGNVGSTLGSVTGYFAKDR